MYNNLVELEARPPLGPYFRYMSCNGSGESKSKLHGDTGPFPAILGVKAPGLNWEKYAAFWVILGIF